MLAWDLSNPKLWDEQNPSRRAILGICLKTPLGFELAWDLASKPKIAMLAWDVSNPKLWDLGFAKDVTLGLGFLAFAVCREES